MKPNLKKSTSLFILLFALSALYRAETVFAAVDRESESARIAGGLRAYSDQDWAQIAGEKSSEKYEIARGDTLWSISARLFGEPKVWPKIWEINNTDILNPHMIEPRMNLVFNAGSALSLPTLSLKSTGVTTVTNHYKIEKEDRPGPIWDEKTRMPGNEWKYLPRQSWENVQSNLPANIDKDGFDAKNRIYLRKPATGLELSQTVACNPIQPLGSIVGTRSLTTFVHRGSEVTIRSAGAPLQIQGIYSMLGNDPMKIQSGARSALSYEVVGKVKIIGVTDGTYIGEIFSARSPIARGAVLVPEIKRIENRAPVPGPANVKGSLISDRRTSAFMSGPNKWVYIDRGTQDGVGKGMIFRIFQNIDPKSGKPLTLKESFVQGDVQILQGCENFSVGMFVWSRGEVPERYEGRLLTNVSDEKIRFYFDQNASSIRSAELPPVAPFNPIDDLPPPPIKEAIVGPSINPDLLVPLPPAPESELLPEPPTEVAAPELPAPPFEELPPVAPPAAEAAPLVPSLEDDGKDWLDALDNHQNLRSEEENELLQLEQFRDGNSKHQAKQSAPADLAPMESEPFDLPPPPASESASSDLPPPPPGEEFPSDEPIVEVPIAPRASPGRKSATGPKLNAPFEEAPVDESIEGLTPL